MSIAKKKAWGWIILALVLLALVIFREPVMKWFTGFDDDQAVETKQSDKPGLTMHRFSDDELTALSAVFDATEEARIALSEDRVDSLPDSMEKLQTKLALVNNKKLPKEIQAVLHSTQRSAAKLGEAKSTEDARKHYGTLSQATFSLAAIDPRLQEGFHAFSCPMAEGFPKWLQKDEKIANPYMGQSMLECGGGTDWTVDMEIVAHPEGVAHYTCSMHPSVQQKTDGACPICKMDLTPVTHEDLRSGEVSVDSVRRQRIGVRTEKVIRRQLVRPIRAVGEVAWDESRVHDVTARVDGWVEDLRVKREGDAIKRNATLLRFYSPDLLATQQELLAVPEGSRLSEFAKERLRLWGMSAWAIRRLLRTKKASQRIGIQSPIAGVVVDKRVNEGAHVATGELLFRIVDRSKVWVLADVFEQDLSFVSVGQRVEVQLQGNDTGTLSGEVAHVYPTVSEKTRTAKVRVELDNPDDLLRPGMFANLNFDVELVDHLAVPTDAVIFTGPRRLVFVDRGEGRLRPVEIKVGARTDDWVIVTEGLEEGDMVVSSGAFLLAAESRIRSAADYWDTHEE